MRYLIFTYGFVFSFPMKGYIVFDMPAPESI
jgi:hypothetical protein